MTRLVIFLLTAFMGYSCNAQEKVDLEKLTFKEDPRVIVKNHKKSADRTEPLTSLPAYTTYDIAGYNFGPVALTEHCFVSFLLNSIEEKKLVGLIVGFKTIPESKAIYKYIFQKYGKPVTLQRETQERDSHNKPYPSSSAFLWRNIRPGVSLLLSKSYVFEEGKPVESTDLVLINNDAKPSYETNFKTVLDRVIKTYTP
ncbi:MAG: hypothetical protein JWR38_4245 [Mucilaginibacter sp.]|nr:hypothetical protein [Mucilaginibacter sp.]